MSPRRAVTGGYVYRGQAIRSLAGQYLFMDFCSGELFALQPQAPGTLGGSTRLLGTFDVNASTFGQGSDRELYVADLIGGVVYRLQAAKGPKPRPSLG